VIAPCEGEKKSRQGKLKHAPPLQLVCLQWVHFFLGF
jgi:hypothetical protein